MSEAISAAAHDDSLLPPLSVENNHTLGTEGLLMLSQSRKIHPENTCKWRKEKSGFVFCFPPLPPCFPGTVWAKQRVPALLLLEEAEFGTSRACPVPTAPMWVLLGNRMWGQILGKVNGFWLSQGRKLFSRSIGKQHTIARTGLCIKHKGSYICSNTRFPMTAWPKHSGVSLQPQGTWEAAFLQLPRLLRCRAW